MTRAVVDQDITPTDRLTGQLPDEWSFSVGIPADPDGLSDAIAGAEVVFVTSRIAVTREIIENAAELELVAKLGTGIDNVDLDAAREHGVTVTHTPGHNALSVAEHTLGLTLATARRLTEARDLIERGAWRDEYSLGTRLSGSTVGIVGFGDIGTRFGTLLSGFDVEILIADPYVATIDAELVAGEMTTLDDLLERSDVVALTTELTAETEGLIGARELDLMDDDAFLVNTARGPVVDESALLGALRTDSIAGAGLDVFETEPLGPDAELLEFDSVVTTPHISAMTDESRAETIDRLAANVRTLREGGDLQERYLAAP